MADEETKESKSFKDWYQENKETISSRRKKLYREDPEHREAVKLRQAEYRKTHPPLSRAGRSKFKIINGIKVEVFRIGETSQRVGRDEQTIRGWEDRGLIPAPTAPGVHRNYTEKQIALMKELADLIDNSRYDKEGLQVAIAAKSIEIKSNWGK